MKNERPLALILRQLRDKLPGTATIHSIDANRADIRLGASPSVIRNVPIEGDPKSLLPGQEVSLRWESRPGSFGPAPTVLAAAGTGTSGGGAAAAAVIVDNRSIENSANGLRVKQAGISTGHLNFVPSLEGHTHPDALTDNGWQVSPDGVIFQGGTSIHPTGQIALGSGSDIIKLDSRNAVYRLWAGNTDPVLAPFSVSKGGELRATSAYIQGELQSTTFSHGLTGWHLDTEGNAEFNNVLVRGSLQASVFEKSIITAYAGSLMVSKSASSLQADLVVPPPIVPLLDLVVRKQAGGAPFAANDIVCVRDIGAATWFSVDAGADNGGDTWKYKGTFRTGTTNHKYVKGETVIDYGQTSGGWLYMTADDANAPYYSVKTWTTNPWSASSVVEQVRIGNLNGNWGYSSPNYGVAMGRYAASAANITIDPANGLRMRIHDTTYIQLDNSGGAYIAGTLVLDASGRIRTAGNEMNLDTTGLYFKGSPQSGSVPQFITWMNSSGIREAEVGYLFDGTGSPRGLWINLMAGDLLVSTYSGLGSLVLQDTTDLRVGGGLYVGGTGVNPGAGMVVTTGDIYTSAMSDYSGSSTVTGWSSTTTRQIYYKKIGKTVIVYFDIRGTSNSTAAAFSLPFACNSSKMVHTLCRARDNGVYNAGVAYMNVSTSTVILSYTAAASSWTASGVKEATGQIIYEASS